ncbi:MAG: GNAT family N-acetyltransferase [Pseudomonadota bacterium]
MVDLELRIPAESDLPAISELCLRSKAYWGYDPDFIDACRDELTLRSKDLTSTSVKIALYEDKITGVVQLAIDGPKAELRKLFVEPRWIGKGIGKRLLEWARLQARSKGAASMVLTADPDALPFYQAMGFEKIGQERSGSIPGRFLPVCQLML